MFHRGGLGSEHPQCDPLQAVFLVVYLGVWGLDSFILRYSTVFAGVAPFFVRLFLGVLSSALGVYLAFNAHSAVFNPVDGRPSLVTTGVYAYVRHPMYMGVLLFYLGFFLTTFSLLSLLVWAGLLVFYDRMATYEERDLHRILGEQYLTYQRQVPKWLPHIGKRRNE